MCEHGQEELVEVLVPAELSHTGKAQWKRVGIDACIVSIVEALSSAGVHMRGCCCGHGSGEGDILLQDGRVLIILSPELAKPYYAQKRRISDVIKDTVESDSKRETRA